MKKTILIFVIGILFLGAGYLYAQDADLTVKGETTLATDSGNVNIGPVHVMGGLTAKFNLATMWPDEYFAKFFNSGDAGILFGIDTQANRAKIQGEMDNSPYDLLINPDGGNVGIGTTTPQRVLHIVDVMRLEPRSSAPANPSNGDIYIVGNKMYVHIGNRAREIRFK